MTFQGKITFRSDEQTGQGKNGEWRKVNFVIDNGDQFPDRLLVTAFNDRAKQVQEYKVGDTVECVLSANVREYNGRHYQDLTLYKIVKVEVAETATAPAPATEKAVKATAYMEAATAKPKEPVYNDLPF